MRGDWVRLGDWISSGEVGVTARCARRWIRDGIGGVTPPEGTARVIGGRWWVHRRRLAEWIEAVGAAPRSGRAESAPQAESRTQEVWQRWSRLGEE